MTVYDRWHYEYFVAVLQLLIKDGELNKLSRKLMQPRMFFLVFLTFCMATLHTVHPSIHSKHLSYLIPVYCIDEMLVAVAKQTYVLLAASRFLGLPCCAAEQLMSLADTTI